MVAAAHRTAQGCAQHSAHHDGRRGVRCAQHVWRRCRDTGVGSHREKRAAVHAVPYHFVMLTHARRLDHGTKPSRGRLWGCGGSCDGVPGVRFDNQEGHRHHRRDPQGERVRDCLVRQGPQHAFLPGEPGRAIRSMARRDGLRVFLRLRRRRYEPVAAEPVPQHDGHLPLRWPSRMEPHHRDG